MTRNYRRRNYFIKKGFQSRFILRFLLVSSLWSALSIALFNFLAYRELDKVLFSMRLPAGNIGGILFKQALYANSAALVLIIFTFLLTARGIHNKIVRSLFRIRVDIQRLVRGDLGSRVMLSREDEFRDFAETLSGMAGELHRKFSDIQSRLDQITWTAAELKVSTDGDNRALYEEIRRHAGAMEETIREFKK